MAYQQVTDKDDMCVSSVKGAASKLTRIQYDYYINIVHRIRFRLHC